MKVLIASDHAGIDLKTELKKNLPQIEWEDLGPQSKDSVDYPDFADKVASLIQRDPSRRGVLICGSGQGMVMRANKYSNVRAALVWMDEIAKLARQHNDANILSLPARFISLEEAARFVNLFLATPFEGGRHAARVEKVGRPTEGGTR